MDKYKEDKLLFKLISNSSGYTDGLEPLKFSDGWYKVLNELYPYLKVDEQINKPADFSNIYCYTREFMNETFKLHPILALKSPRLNNRPRRNAESEEALSSLRVLTRKIDAFRLPIRMCNIRNYGETVQEIVSLNYNSPLPYHPYSHIKLSRDINEYGFYFYPHEIMHTQLESVPGYTKSYLNSELLSIFLEGLVYLNRQDDIYQNIRLLRIKSMIIQMVRIYKNDMGKKPYSYTKMIKGSLYIESTLKAFKLFDIYEKCLERNIAKEMINDIQRILDGENTIEELLDKYEVNLEASTDIKTLKRYLPNIN